MEKVSFIIDGFNLYHSLRDVKYKLNVGTKWLDLYSLCHSFLYLCGKDTELESVSYFSALATHIIQFDPDVVKRHELYLEAIKSKDVLVELSQFKKKDKKCPLCHKLFTSHEEKETDVAVACKIIEKVMVDKIDIICIITGDTDILPALRLVKKINPHVKIIIGFPPYRKNLAFRHIADLCFKISSSQVIKHQFPNNVTLRDGTIVTKPTNW